MVPSTDVMPREGSFALASFGRIEKGPRDGLLALRRPQECRFETDPGSGFGHLPCITDRNALFGRCTALLTCIVIRSSGGFRDSSS